MDLNLTETAMFSTGWHPQNRPSGNYGAGFTFKFWDTRYSGQIFMPCLSRDTELYLRGRYNDQWGNWNRIWHSANVDELNVTALNLANYWQVNNGELNFSGNIGIGTTSPDYTLDVEGTIRTRELKVDMEGADFVFEDDYNLRPLNEVEAFVKANKHLPEIAPAAEMQANGVNQSEINQKLLQKIEELTLYMIEMQKIIKKQNARINNLEN